MSAVKSLAEWMSERRLELADLMERTGIEKRVVRAIVEGRYTPSPDQRQQIASVLELQPEAIAWGHVTPVQHLYGHGPQFGRTP